MEEIPTLQPSRWLDWALGLQDMAYDMDIYDEQAIAVAAMQFRMDKSTRTAIRHKLTNPRPTIPELVRLIREVCTTPEQMILAERRLQEMRQGEDEPLEEYLRRFQGWLYIAENRVPTESQYNEWKTKLLAGLNMYTARLVNVGTYRKDIRDVMVALDELASEDYWEGFKSYKRQPFMPVNNPIAHSRYQPIGHQGPIRQVAKYCRKCDRPGHSTEVCDRRVRPTGPDVFPRETGGYAGRRDWIPPQGTQHRQYYQPQAAGYMNRGQAAQPQTHHVAPPHPNHPRNTPQPQVVVQRNTPQPQVVVPRNAPQPQVVVPRKAVNPGWKHQKPPQSSGGPPNNSVLAVSRNKAVSRVRPQANIYWKDEKIPALIDTGASVNIMSGEWVRNHPDIPRKRSKDTLYPAFGPAARHPETIELEVSASRGGVRCRLLFYVVAANDSSYCIITPNAAELLKIDHLAIPKQVDLKDKVSQLPEPGQDSNGILMKILRDNQDIFKDKLEIAGLARCDPVEIVVPPRTQIFVPSRPVHRDMAEELQEELSRMLEAGVIEPSTAKHNSPLLVVRKPTGRLRVCIDLRSLNQKSEVFKWDFPRVDMALKRMAPATIFSKLDLTSGFWQIGLEQGSKDYTTFRVNGKAWKFTVVPFGWKNSPAVFQAMMDMVLSDSIAGGYVTVYMDDILVHSQDVTQHAEHLREVFKALREHKLVLNPEKCVIGASEVPFLGHILSPSGIRPAPDKLEHIQELATPETREQLRSALGLLGYYAEHINGYAEIARPLTSLMSESRRFHWGPQQQTSWDRLRHEFAKDNPLTYMDWDNTSSFVLTTDASAQAIGARLGRIDKEGQYHVVTNVGRALTSPETRYSNTERELLAITWALKRLELLTAGLPIRVETDHAALIPILTKSDGPVHSNRVYRLHQKLERWTGTGLSIQHIPGNTNVADVLSRPPTIPPANSFREEEESRMQPAAPCSKGGRRLRICRPVRKESTADQMIQVIADDDDDNGEVSEPQGAGEDENSTEANRSTQRSIQMLRASEVSEAQKADEEVIKIKEWLERRQEGKIGEELGPEPVPRASEYKLENGNVIHNRADYHTGRLQVRLYIPKSLRKRAIECAHTSAHHGYPHTMSTLEGFAYWPGYRKEVRQFCSECLTCKERNPESITGTLGEPPLPPHPWHTVGVDLLQLPETADGYKYLLLCVDLLTRYAVGTGLKEKSANAVVKAMRKLFIRNPLLGSPVQILSDNGQEFANNRVYRLLRRHGTKQVFTTPYNPKANGTTERLNRTILQLMRGICEPEQEWTGVLQEVLAIYNNTKHQSIQVTPTEAFTGRPSRHPQLMPDWVAGRIQGSTNANNLLIREECQRMRTRYGRTQVLHDEWRKAEIEWHQTLTRHFEDIGDQSVISRAQQHGVYNRNRQPVMISEGDLVVIKDVHRPPGVAGKLHRPFVGPYHVLKVNPGRTLELADIEGRELDRAIPLDHVKAWHIERPAPAGRAARRF